MVTVTGLRRAAADVARLGLLAFALWFALAPRAGALAIAALGVAGLVWSRGISERNRQLARYVAGFVVFAALRNLCDDAGFPVQYGYPIAWDRALFGSVPTVLLQKAFYRPGVFGPVDRAVVFIYLSYFFIPPTALVLLWRCWPERLRPYVTATLALFATSGLVHLFWPTAPPWLAAENGQLEPVTQVLAAYLGKTAPAPYGYGAGLSGNAVAAMPSVHLGVTGLIALALWSTPLRWPATAYVFAMGFTIVYGAEHYVVDAIAGLFLMGVCWWWARRGGASSGTASRGEESGTTRTSREREIIHGSHLR